MYSIFTQNMFLTCIVFLLFTLSDPYYNGFLCSSSYATLILLDTNVAIS